MSNPKLWIKIFFALTTIFVGMLVFVAFPQNAYAGTLTASVTDATTCTSGGGTVLLRMSGATNAHAELPGQANANYSNNVICGNGVTGLGNSCSGTFATILKLSGLSNAHIEQNSQANYANNACISVSSGSVSVGYATDCAVAGYDTTLGSISGTTNAHVGNSTAYTTKICATATGSVPPSLTSYTNSTETALNYAASCTGCGARIGGGVGFKQTVVITGSNFGTVSDGSQANCAGGAGTGCIKIGTHIIADGNITNTAWTPTQITFTTDSSVTGDFDNDWGTNFGGASALTVTAGGTASGGLNFYVFPQITSVTQPAGFALDTAREYDAADTDGVITLNGTRFGTAQGSGSVITVSQTASPTSWGNTAITVQVPIAIVDTVNTGSISMTQGTGANGKTHTYASTLRVLPRITGFTPGSASEGSAVTVDGNHFCQGAGCPGSFDANNKVVFTSSVQATTFTSWIATAMATAVPTGAVTGNVVLTSNGYASNGKSFTVLSNTPSNPANLDQFRDISLTQSIPIGGTGMGIASSTPIYLKQTMEVPGISGGTLYPQFEYQVAGVTFICGAGACGSAVEGTGSAGPGPATGSKAVSPADANYHWQARTRHNKGGSDYYSGWISFGGNSDPNGIDVKIDTTVPVISSLSPGTPTANTATITWSTNETASTQLAYGVDTALGSGTATTTETDISPTVTSHSVSLSNLSCGTTYYYRARSRDDSGIIGFSAIQNFATSACPVAPAKTTKFHIAGSTGTVTNGSPLSQPFSVEMPETATTTKSIFVEIKGIYSSGAATKDVTVGVNAETTQTYVIPASSVSYFKIIHPVSSIDSTNTLTITPQTNTTLYILSADINITYSYTP